MKLQEINDTILSSLRNQFKAEVLHLCLKDLGLATPEQVDRFLSNLAANASMGLMLLASDCND